MSLPPAAPTGHDVFILGLGNLGVAIGERLVATGHRVTGYDPAGPARSRAAERGIATVDELLGAADCAPVIMSFLPNSRVVREVWHESGLGEALTPGGRVIVEGSTTEPGVVTALETHLRREGVAVVDLGVGRGPDEARAGALSLMVGGADPDVDAVEHLLRALGEVHRVGGVGDGKTLKLINNLISITNMAVAAEGFVAGVRAGIEPRVLSDVLGVSGASSQAMTRRIPRWVAQDREARFSVDLALKDLALGLDVAKGGGSPAPISALVFQLYGILATQGGGAGDILEMVALYEEWSRPAG